MLSRKMFVVQTYWLQGWFVVAWNWQNSLPQIGFDLGEKSSNEAGKALRLLHIEDLRLLQTQINEAIVAAQSQTADPKTDTTLGKVGR